MIKAGGAREIYVTENGLYQETSSGDHLPAEGRHQEWPQHAALSGHAACHLEKMVRRAHEGLGHPERERFLRILRHSRAPEEVVQIAKDLRCSVCGPTDYQTPLDEVLLPRSRSM